MNFIALSTLMISLGAEPQPSEPEPKTYEEKVAHCHRLMVKQLNDYRSSRGRTKLVQDKRLCEAAQRYAEYCARNGGYGHRADGRSPGQRATAAGFPHTAIGENWAYAGGRMQPAGALRMWQRSRGHNGNMLNSGWNFVGVGASKHRGRRIFVQMFSY